MIGHPFIMSPNMAANIVQLNAFHNYKYTDEIVFFTQGIAKVINITTSLKRYFANLGKKICEYDNEFCKLFLIFVPVFQISAI